MLQKARFDERLDYNIKMDESLSDFLIPKISILTLVENSVNHGLEQSPGRICIKIDILLNRGYLVIKVVDDGCGMSTEKLTEIRRQLEYENGMTGSIDLKTWPAGFIFYITEWLRWKLTVHRKRNSSYFIYTAQ